jgi:hypothetical protein
MIRESPGLAVRGPAKCIAAGLERIEVTYLGCRPSYSFEPSALNFEDEDLKLPPRFDPTELRCK